MSIYHTTDGKTTILRPENGLSFIEVDTAEYANVLRLLRITAALDTLTKSEIFLLKLLREFGLTAEDV